MTWQTFRDEFIYAYNTTVQHTPGFDYLYGTIPVLSDEEAFRQGLIMVRKLLTAWRTLKPPKFLSLIREIDRASPRVYQYVLKHHPDLHHALNPRGGTVPTTYAFRQFGQGVGEIAEKVGGQLLAEARKALPNILRSLLGMEFDAAKEAAEKAASRMAKKLAMNPEIEWCYVAGWVGLVIGSLCFATLSLIGVNQAVEGAMQGVFEWWYGVPEIEASTARMQAALIRKKMNVLRQSIAHYQSIGVAPDHRVLELLSELQRAAAGNES